METQGKETGKNPHPAANQSVLPSTNWLWNPLSYLWGNQPAEAQEAPEEISPHANKQEKSDDFSPIIQQVAHLLTETSGTTILTDANTPNSASSALPDNTDNVYVPFAFRPILPSPAASLANPHPAQDTAEEDAAIARITVLSMSEPASMPLAVTSSDVDYTIEKTNTDHEEAAASVSTKAEDQKTSEETAVQQGLIAKIAKLQSDNMRLEQQLEQLRQENLRKSEEKSQQEAMLLRREQERQQAEAQAAEEQRKAAEDAFSKSCSTKARTLEEHYKLARAAAARAGF